MTISQFTRYAKYKRYYVDLVRVLQQEKAQKSLSLVLSLFLISILVTFALKPSLQKIIEIKKEINDLNKISQQLTKKQKSLQAANLKWPRLEKAATLMEQMIPKGPKALDFLEEVEDLASKTKVEYEGGALEELGFIKSKENIYNGSNLIIMRGDFNLRLAGNYDNLMDFITNLKKGRRLISLETINFIKRNNKDEINRIDLNLKGKVYYLGSQQLEKIKQKIGEK